MVGVFLWNRIVLLINIYKETMLLNEETNKCAELLLMRENSVCLIISILFACCLTKSILADKCVPLKTGLKICCFHWFCCVSWHSAFCFCVFLALLFYEKVIFFDLLPQHSQVQVVWLDFWFLLQSFSFSKSMSHMLYLALPHSACMQVCLETAASEGRSACDANNNSLII